MSGIPSAPAWPTLCIFAKRALRGRVKTRLAADIGDTAALAVYRALLVHTATVAATWPGPVHVHVAGVDGSLGPLERFPQHGQSDGELGRRLRHGLADHLPAIAIGTDCPGLARDDLLTVAHLLCDQRAVLAPALDGGYWALGVADTAAMRCCCADDLPWSQPELVAATTAACEAQAIAWTLGPRRRDLDDLNDLRAARGDNFAG